MADSALIDDLSDRLFDRALLRGDFTLRSGATSDRYFDKYRFSTDPQLLGEVAKALAALIAEVSPDAQLIAAPELGAVPLAVATSLETGLPFVIVRKRAKQHATSERIEGVVRIGAEAVLMEDVVTSGGAALDALDAIRTAGMTCSATVSVLDRASGGAQALNEAGAPLRALLGVDDLDRAYAAGIGTEMRG
jgi:orotate phosphoribosyltransferase